MSDRPGCLGRLLPARLVNLARGRKALTTAHTLPHKAPSSVDADAVARAHRAAQRCMHALHHEEGFHADVLDDVGGAVQALADAAQALADRLEEARTWLRTHNPEHIRGELVDLELGLASERSLAEEQADRRRETALKAQLKQAVAVQLAEGRLRSTLLATVGELERLEAQVTAARVDGHAGGLLAEVKRQEADTRRALEAWRATAEELADGQPSS